MLSGGALMANVEQWVLVECVVAHFGVARDSVSRWIERREVPSHCSAARVFTRVDVMKKLSEPW